MCKVVLGVVVPMTVLLAACGGGGSSGGTPPATSPSFSAPTPTPSPTLTPLVILHETGGTLSVTVVPMGPFVGATRTSICAYALTDSHFCATQYPFTNGGGFASLWKGPETHVGTSPFTDTYTMISQQVRSGGDTGYIGITLNGTPAYLDLTSPYVQVLSDSGHFRGGGSNGFAAGGWSWYAFQPNVMAQVGGTWYLLPRASQPLALSGVGIGMGVTNLGFGIANNNVRWEPCSVACLPDVTNTCCPVPFYIATVSNNPAGVIVGDLYGIIPPATQTGQQDPRIQERIVLFPTPTATSGGIILDFQV